jgi:hypothetical protein
LQVSQALSQALSQQVPSAQKPLVHSVPAAHASPLAFEPRHAPAWQVALPWH